MESLINPAIVDRGRRYVESGRVGLVEKIGDYSYRAQVKGSDLYQVMIKLDKSDAITSSDCTCPFDGGPVCKHQVAVLMMIRAAGTEDAAWSSRTINHGVSEARYPLAELLQSQSKDRLIDLLLSLAYESELVTRRIQFFFDAGDPLMECRGLIRSYIEGHADRHGFVDYRNVGGAVEGAQLVMDKARAATDWRLSVTMSFCVLEEMLDLLQEADDSDGTIGGVIGESLEWVDEIASDPYRMGESERSALFYMLLNKSGDPRFDGWSDWQLTLLRQASQLAGSADLKSEWDRHVEGLLARQKQSNWNRNYFGEQVALMQYQWICDHAGQAEAEEFLQSHLHVPEFRKRAIEAALTNGRYDDAMQLAQDGEAADQARGYRGRVIQWKAFRYQAAVRSGRVELQRALGKELVLDGDYAYYPGIKATYSAEEWPAVYQDILQTFERQRGREDVYTRILVEEQETGRLLAYVQQQPARIEKFHQHLIEPFRPDVIQLFQVHIEQAAARSTTRTQYQNVCRIIRQLQEAGGREEAVAIAHTLLNKYSNKPAFRDELSRVIGR